MIIKTIATAAAAAVTMTLVAVDNSTALLVEQTVVAAAAGASTVADHINNALMDDSSHGDLDLNAIDALINGDGELFAKFLEE